MARVFKNIVNNTNIKSLTGLAIALCLLTTIGTLWYFYFQKFRNLHYSIEHSHKVLKTNQNLLNSITDAETGQRGYLLTGNRRYLEPYNTARKKINREIAALHQLTLANYHQQQYLKTLEGLVAAKLAELEQTIDLMQTEGAKSALQVVQSNRGQLLMTDIRKIIHQIETEEYQLLNTRSQQEQLFIQKTVLLIFLGCVLVFGLINGANFLIGRESTKRKQMETAVQQSTEQMQLAVESTGLGTWDYYPTTGKLQFSERCKAILGLAPDVEPNYNLFLLCLHPADRDRTHEVVQNTLAAHSNGEYHIEYRTLQSDGTIRWVEAMGRVFFNESRQAYRFIGTLLDITKRKLAEEQIKASLQEKEVLLKEIHHRVKNNMQIVCSLLNLQAASIEDPQVLEILQEGQNRVSSMSLIHEYLYESPDLAKIDFAQYIHTLATNLLSSYNIYLEQNALKIHIDNVFLSIDTAIPCGLIINELISNSLKYAFPTTKVGEICVEFFRVDDDYLTLIVKDNGVGIPQDLDWENTESLGLQLVVTLTSQLLGSIELNRDAGTEFKIVFPEKN